MLASEGRITMLLLAAERNSADAGLEMKRAHEAN